MNRKLRILLEDFIEILICKYQHDNKKGFRHLQTSKSSLHKFKPGIFLHEIDSEFCSAYNRWLLSPQASLKNKPLSKMTAHVYSAKLRLILQKAVEMNILSQNPFDLLDRYEKISEPQSLRRYLTKEEIFKLEKNTCEMPLVKNAFLFACFSGLRISDIRRIRWCDLHRRHSRIFLEIKMHKTGRNLSIPLCDKALVYLPLKSSISDLIFYGLPQESALLKHLKLFCHSAGIRGDIKFHTARHTFATLLISAGADIYTVSKLLGHSNIKSTLLYANISDSKKYQSISLLNEIP